MSRSGYDDCGDDMWAMIRWRGAVASSIRGKRGQAFLKEMLSAMDAMPEKVLIAEDLVNSEGDVCALGTVGKARGIDMTKVDPEEYDEVAKLFCIPLALAREIEYINDEWGSYGSTPQDRFNAVRKWVVEQIRSEAS